jgi:hypothetical protein
MYLISGDHLEAKNKSPDFLLELGHTKEQH